MLRRLAALSLAVLLAAVPASAQTPPDFSETFTNNPSSPQPFSSPRWDVLVHHRGASQGVPMEPMLAQHGPDCGPPMATHPIAGEAESVFACRDHMMTAINAGDYGLIYLTPDVQVDFTQGEAVVRWDQSTLRGSNRDWVDLWITPYADNLAAPLESWIPDLQGRPRNAVHVRQIDNQGGTGYLVWVIRDGVETQYGDGWPQLESIITPSAVTRSTFELRISRTRVSFGMPSAGLEWVDAAIPSLDWSRGVVQLGHHSYNPNKACDFDGTCGPNTWHWDNVEIHPAAPLTFVKAQGVPDWHAGNDTVTLDGPAPAGASLRMQAVGTNMRASFDGGTSWVALTRQPSEVMSGDQGHMQPYWHPIPAGVGSVKLRGDDWYGGPWRSNYAAVWAQGSAASAPTATATLEPTATSTPVPPTATIEPTPAVCTYRVYRNSVLVAEWGC